MAEPSGTISKMQILALARRLKSTQNTEQEAGALEQLAETGLSEGQQTQLHDMMQDKAKLAQMLQSPQAQALMRKLQAGKQE